jgi:hypothetical protein
MLYRKILLTLYGGRSVDHLMQNLTAAAANNTLNNTTSRNYLYCYNPILLNNIAFLLLM